MGDLSAPYVKFLLELGFIALSVIAGIAIVTNTVKAIKYLLGIPAK